MNNQVLFVDDEPYILQGLQRMLRVLRDEMDFFFAKDGSEALQILAGGHFDVIVSDMRMPGMDGGTLLTTVKENYPNVVRIMLTGQADETAILKSVPVVHQFLAKPINPDALKSVLHRACALQKVLNNQALKSTISSLVSLPSLPRIYEELQKKILDPECSIGDIAAIIEKDMAMTAKVLQLVNSSFFGLSKNITSPAHAVNLLGLDTINALVLGVGVFSEMKAVCPKHFNLAKLWEHSVAVATFAKTISQAESDDRKFADTVFIAGMMHDVGKLLLLATFAKTYAEVVDLAVNSRYPLHLAETQLIGSSHGEVGSYLMGLWGLPGAVIEALAFHHQLDSYPHPCFSAAVAVHAADQIYYQLAPQQCVGAPPQLNTSYLEKAGVNQRYQYWLESCRKVQS